MRSCQGPDGRHIRVNRGLELAPAAYPTLLAAVGDVAHPMWRGRAVGVYRLWRDNGFAAGALLAGLIADLWGLAAAVWVAAASPPALGWPLPIAWTRPLTLGHRPLIGMSRSIGSTAAANRSGGRFPGTWDRWSRAHTTLDV